MSEPPMEPGGSWPKAVEYPHLKRERMRYIHRRRPVRPCQRLPLAGMEERALHGYTARRKEPCGQLLDTQAVVAETRAAIVAHACEQFVGVRGEPQRAAVTGDEYPGPGEVSH